MYSKFPPPQYAPHIKNKQTRPPSQPHTTQKPQTHVEQITKDYELLRSNLASLPAKHPTLKFLRAQMKPNLDTSLDTVMINVDEQAHTTLI